MQKGLCSELLPIHTLFASQGAPTQPLKLDEKHKKFYQLFDHVTDVQATEYGGQAVAPNKEVEFQALPDKPHEHPLPDVSKVPERDYLQEDMEARQRTALPEQKHSQRYDKAHDAFVKTFGCVVLIVGTQFV